MPPSGMVNTTSRAMTVAAQGRAELIASIRFEKNAVIIQDKTLGAEYAALKLASIWNGPRRLQDELSKLGSANGHARKRSPLDLDRALGL